MTTLRKLTDEEIEQDAAEAEAGFPHWTFGKSIAGRPVSVGEDARPVTLRLDAARRAKLKAVAAERHTNPSQVMRDLIDAL